MFIQDVSGEAGLTRIENRQETDGSEVKTEAQPSESQEGACVGLSGEEFKEEHEKTVDQNDLQV